MAKWWHKCDGERHNLARIREKWMDGDILSYPKNWSEPLNNKNTLAVKYKLQLESTNKGFHHLRSMFEVKF